MLGGALYMVFEKLRAILVDQLDVDEDAVTMESSIIDDLGADSLDVVDMVMSLEEDDIEIPEELAESVKTVEDIVKFIESNTDAES
jgi:acyl carrier protein